MILLNKSSKITLELINQCQYIARKAIFSQKNNVYSIIRQELQLLRLTNAAAAAAANVTVQ